MKKILSYLTVFAVLITSVSVGILPAKADYPACGPVKGGDTTFLVCNGRQINHFWSGTKIRVKSVDDNGAQLRIFNETTGFDTVQYFANDGWFSFIVGTKNNSGDAYNDYISLDITYLGRDIQDPNRVLIKVDSNTTYEDSFQVIKLSQPTITEMMLNVLENTLELSWSQVDGASYYNFQVEKNTTNGYILVDDITDVYDTVFYDYIPSSGTGDYRVRVMANDLAGHTSDWSEYHVFSYNNVVDNVIPKPILTVSEPYYKDGSFYVDLSWDSVSGDYSYYPYMEFSLDGSNYGMHTFHTNAGNSGISFEVNDEGYYRVNVSRYLNSWDNNAESDYVYFTFNLDMSSAPTLQVTDSFPMYGERYVTFYWDNELIIPNDFLIVEHGADGNSYGEKYNDSIFSAGSISVLVSESGYYRAYIRRFDGVGYVDSNYVSFYLDNNYNNNQNSNLDVPVISFPSQNQNIYLDKTDNYNYGFNLPDLTIYTTWNQVDGVTNYEVNYEYYDENTNTWLGYGTFYPSETRDVLQGWIDTGKFRVKVRSVNNTITSDWSDWTQFTVYNHNEKFGSDSSGEDGLYSGYKGNSIYHSPTGINIKINGYTENTVYLNLENAEWNSMYVMRGQSYTVWNQSYNGQYRGLKVYFDDITDAGVQLHLETVYMQLI